MSIILASASPRRRELLEMLGVKDMKVIPAQGEETAPEGLRPEELVMALAAGKAREVAESAGPDDIVIGADTIVWAGGKVLGKPRSEDEAEEMLLSLSGRSHQVYTGLCLISDGRESLEYEMSTVHFRELGFSELWNYIASGEPMDKAGAYGAQGLAALFIRGIEGDFFNVMGLPLCRLGQMLKQRGVELL